MTRLRALGQGDKCALFFPNSALFMGGEYAE